MASINKKFLSGNGIVIYMDGQPVGGARSLRSSFGVNPEAVREIGNIDPQEHVPTAADYNLSLTGVVLSSGSLREKGIIPENGDGALVGTVFDIVQMDKSTGRVLAKYTGCSYASGDVEISANAVVVNNATFMALGKTGSVA